MGEFFCNFRVEEDTLIVTIGGDVRQPAAESFRQKFSERMSLKISYKKVVFNLSQVGYFDSAGLGILIQATKICEASGSESILENPSTTTRYILSSTGLTSYFTIEEH